MQHRNVGAHEKQAVEQWDHRRADGTLVVGEDDQRVDRLPASRRVTTLEQRMPDAICDGRGVHRHRGDGARRCRPAGAPDKSDRDKADAKHYDDKRFAPASLVLLGRAHEGPDLSGEGRTSSTPTT